jgi:hypothetical protein
MNHSKAMGLGAMLLFLVAAVVLLPIVVRFIDKMEPHYVSGFQDFAVPTIPKQGGDSTYRPDRNTDYLCSSPNGSGQSCPEGTFCDGSSQQCVSTYVGGEVPDTGYFS